MAVFGCDIGNAYGYISLLTDPAKDPRSCFPAIYEKYGLDRIGMPTSAYISPPDGKTIEVFDGRPAIDKHRREADCFVHAAKTRLKEGKIKVRGINDPVHVVDIYGAIARDLITLGNQYRRDSGESEITEVVFTYPAKLAEDLPLLNKLQKSIERIKVGNEHIKVRGRIPEPAAVAIDYLYYMQNIVPENERLQSLSCTVLVYDLGHGTFDTAVVTARSKGEPYELHMFDGLPDVGGKNFDELLYEEICRSLKADYDYVPGNAEQREVIRELAVNVKHALSEEEIGRESLILPNGESADIEITQNWFEERSRGMIAQTLEMVDQFLQQADAKQIPVDAIVLSGGGSHMPMVVKGLKELLAESQRNLPIHMYRPSEAVSFGASRYAYAFNEQLIQYTKYGYGFRRSSEQSLYGKMQMLLKSGETLPATSSVVELQSESDRLELNVCQTEKESDRLEDRVLDADWEEQYRSMMYFHFDVPPQTTCRVKLMVLEDLNVQVECTTSDGKVLTKSTMDEIEKLM
ncbi:MAG: Hsp70 family protein [Lachnospiraceae bacterium]|nr:Hsp70 family protein [Lachnospiraceae bacterium]